MLMMPMTRIANLVLCVLLLLSLGNCGGNDALTISAASSLTFALKEIARDFELETGIRVELNFGATGRLAQQIEHGAPVDLFLAAGTTFVEELEQKGMLLADSKAIYATGKLTFWSREEDALASGNVDLLLHPSFARISIANPRHAPYGRLTQEALATADIWEQLQDKLIIAANTRQALQYAQTGDVDLAIIPLSLSQGTDGHWSLVPDEFYAPMSHLLAIPKSAPHQAEAKRFVQYLTSQPAQAFLAQYGFGLPIEHAPQ